MRHQLLLDNSVLSKVLSKVPLYDIIPSYEIKVRKQTNSLQYVYTYSYVYT